MKGINKIGLVLLLCIGAESAAQKQSSLDTLVGRFGHYREHAYQEKIYGHLDRTFYLTGETLWFKLYTVDGAFHKPSDLSKVAYVEVLDKMGFAVLQAKVELKGGLGSGSFFIPASLSSGNYRFRAYTSWMKNFPPEFYFSQTVSIVNTFVAPEPLKPVEGVSCKVDFFPEGGELVSGIQSKVAFKVTDDKGDIANCQGVILDNEGDTAAYFSPHGSGLGHFLITPSSGKKYKAVITDGQGRRKESAFPEIQPRGYTLQLFDSADHLRVEVRSAGVDDGGVYLFVHARQVVVHAQSNSLRDNRALFVIQKSALPAGISHLTVFTQDLQPVCERLYFKYPRKELDIAISTNQKTIARRKRVSVVLETKDEGAPSPANLSLSVFRIDSLSSLNATNIHQYLWLRSDLPGALPSPEYFFGRKANEKDRFVAMDNLMLTHGWRRFDWEDILNRKQTFSFLPEVREHIVSGIVSKDQKEARGVFTYLGSPGRIIRAYGSWSNENGAVRFEIKDFYGPRRIILQTKTDTTENYDIRIQDPFSSLRSTETMPELVLEQRSQDDLLARSIGMQVQDVFYYDEWGEQTLTPEVDSSAFYGTADATYFLDDYTRFPVMEEVMREYVPGVFVRKRKDGFHFLVVDLVNGGVLPGDPAVLVDGVPVLDVDDIMRMDPLRVKKLEVVKRPYYLGQAVFFGVVSFTTYRGDLGGLELDPRSVTLNYDGLQLKRKFHSPQYLRGQQNDRMPDQRHLLHWEPEIKTDDQGKHQLEFYTSDVPGEYMIVVEGMDADGCSGSKTYRFTVTSDDNR